MEKNCISIIINNYNYQEYLSAAIKSVLEQDFKNFSLIIVDDGSTDNSRSVIDSFSNNRIIRVYKNNGGQLSCFNAAMEYINSDIVAFLDADDIYLPGYLSFIDSFYSMNIHSDFLIVGNNYFGDACQRNRLVNHQFNFKITRDLAYYNHSWIGSMTSTLSMRTSLLRRILPLYSIEQYWKTRADDILVWGASLENGRKSVVPDIFINYRIHGNNAFWGKVLSPDERRKRTQALEKFWMIYIGKRQLFSYIGTIREILSCKRELLNYYGNIYYDRSIPICVRIVIFGILKIRRIFYRFMKIRSVDISRVIV